MNYSENPGKQYHIQVGKGDVGRYVILPGDPKRCAKIAKYFDGAKLMADNREYVTYTGALDGVPVSVTSTGIGGPSAAIAVEELVLSAPIEFPAVADVGVVNALREAAGELGAPCHTGVVQSKDSFYGQHSPETKPVSYELLSKWEAWKRMGCLASEMESAALFIVAGALRVRAGACFLTVANQERERLGLENPVVHDTDLAVRVAVQALRRLIAVDRAREDA